MTQRLILLLLSHWDEVSGYAVAHNLPDLEDMEVSRLVSFLYWYFTRNASADSVATFRAKLWRPPPGVAITPESPWSAQNESAAFSSFANQFSSMGKS